MSSFRMFQAVMVSALVLLCCAPVRGDVMLGDFEGATPFAGWTLDEYPSDGSTITQVNGYAGHDGGIARLQASVTYTWDGSMWNGTYTAAALTRGGITLGSETALAFDALAELDGVELTNPYVSMVVPLSPLGGYQDIAPGGWQHYVMPLDELSPTQAFSFIANADAVGLYTPGTTVGQTQVQTVTLYLDNVQLVPAPAALLLILAGAPMLLRRRAR